MVSHWSDSKPPQVFRTLFNIRADLNNAVVWMISTRLLISKPSSLCINPLVTVPRAPITIGITISFMWHSLFCFFFDSLARSKHLSFFLLSFNFTHWFAGREKSTIQQVLFFLLAIIKSGRLAEIR